MGDQAEHSFHRTFSYKNVPSRVMCSQAFSRRQKRTKGNASAHCLRQPSPTACGHNFWMLQHIPRIKAGLLTLKTISRRLIVRKDVIQFLVLWLQILSSWIKISSHASLFSDEMTLPQTLLVNATFKGLMLYHAVFSLLSGDSACKLDDKFKSTRTSYNSGIMTKFNWFTLVFWCSQICSV